MGASALSDRRGESDSSPADSMADEGEMSVVSASGTGAGAVRVRLRGAEVQRKPQGSRALRGVRDVVELLVRPSSGRRPQWARFSFMDFSDDED